MTCPPCTRGPLPPPDHSTIPTNSPSDFLLPSSLELPRPLSVAPSFGGEGGRARDPIHGIGIKDAITN